MSDTIANNASWRSLVVLAVSAASIGALAGSMIAIAVLHKQQQRRATAAATAATRKEDGASYRSLGLYDGQGKSEEDGAKWRGYDGHRPHSTQPSEGCEESVAPQHPAAVTPVAYHTAQGGILSHYLDPLTRITTDEFYRTHAKRQGGRTGKTTTGSRNTLVTTASFGTLHSPLRYSISGATLGDIDVAVDDFARSDGLANFGEQRAMGGHGGPASPLATPPLQSSSSPSNANMKKQKQQRKKKQLKVLSPPRNPIYRIVITGGPCSGKSTCMTYLKAHLESLGYSVYCVPEVATLLMTGGARLWLTPDELAEEEAGMAEQAQLKKVTKRYQEMLMNIAAYDEDNDGGSSSCRIAPHSSHSMADDDEEDSQFDSASSDGNDSDRQAGERHHKRTKKKSAISPSKVVTQRVVLQLMMMLEDCFYELAAIRGKPAVLLYDRGTMDGSAYCSDDDWAKILAATGYTNEELRDTRYDAVVHFVTAALGAESHYSLENNATRRETVEEAIEVDAATRRAWRGHFLVYIVDNSTNFEKKLERVAAFIRKVIGVSSEASPFSSSLSGSAPLGAARDMEKSRASAMDLQELSFVMTGTRALPRGGVCASSANSREPSVAAINAATLGFGGGASAGARMQSVLRDVNASTIGSTLVQTMPATRDYADEELQEQRGRNAEGAEPEAANPEGDAAAIAMETSMDDATPPFLAKGCRRQTLPPHALDVEESGRQKEDSLFIASPLCVPSMCPVDGAVSWSTAAVDGVQRHFMVKTIDRSQIPKDAVGADVMMIFLIPTHRDYISEMIIRRVSDSGETAHQQQRPVYLRRVEYADPVFPPPHTYAGATAGDESRSPSIDHPTTGGSCVCRNVSTRSISKEEFLSLAENFDPTQPLVRKHTQRFVHGLKHIALVTFVHPQELSGVSRVVGPADLSVEDLPPWITVDEEISLTGRDSMM